MADKHKAPAQVTIAKTEEESDLQAFAMRYWPHAVAIALVVSSSILYTQWSAGSSQAEIMQGWARLGQDLNLAQGFSPPSATILADVAEDLADQPAGPWAKAVEVGRRLVDDDVEGARRAVAELESTWPEHPLASRGLFPRPDGDGPPRSLADHLEADLAALQGWEQANPHLFSNPPLPDDAPRVRIVTSAGSIVIGLYQEQAPLHTENFLKLCGEGFYDGVLFHRVVQGFMVQAGDPNTRDAEATETWGQGGPGYTLEPEVGSLWHFTGAVAAAATVAGGETSGSQFYVMTSDDHHRLDGDYTVFGALLEGQDVVTTIETAPGLGERPTEPVVIESTEVL